MAKTTETGNNHAQLAAIAATGPKAPLTVHEPAAGQRVDIDVVPGRELVFDFNPLNAQATVEGSNLVLTFPDEGVLVLHHISGAAAAHTQLELPDGNVIAMSQLLQGFNLGDIVPAAGDLAAIQPQAGGPNGAPNTGANFRSISCVESPRGCSSRSMTVWFGTA